MGDLIDAAATPYWLVGHPGQGIWMPFDEFHTEEAAEKFAASVRKASILCHKQEDRKLKKP
jgi:hypothetical protein